MGLLVLIGVVGLLFILATKDATLVKNLFFHWAVTGLFLVFLATSLFRGKILIPRSRMMLPLGVYLLLAIVSTAFSAYRYASAQELMSLLCCAMLVFVTAWGVTSRRAFLVVMGAIAVVASLSCLYAISQHYGFDPFFGNEPDLLEQGRSFSTMGHPNFFASFLVLTLPVFLSLFYLSNSPVRKSFLALVICGLELSLFYTHSRGAWLGLLGAMPVWFFLWLGMGLTIAAGTMTGQPATRKQKVRQGDNAAQPSESFYELNLKPVRAPALRAGIVFLLIAAMGAGAWCAKRAWTSAVLTRRGEGYEMRAEMFRTANAPGEDVLRNLNSERAARENAIELYNRAIELNPYNLTAYYKLGYCYNLHGQFEESLQAYLRIAELSPDYCDLHFNLGTVYSNMRRWEDSRSEYETALRMKIGPLTRIGLARAYANLELFDKAREQYEALLNANRNDVRAMNGLAGLEMRLGNNEKAMELSRKAVQTDPENAEARLNLGLIHQTFAYEYRRRGDETNAAEHFEKSIAELKSAVTKRPGALPARAALALVYADLGRMDEALSELRIGLSISPANPLLHLNLGKVFRRQNRPDQAAEAFRRAIEIDPKGASAAEARRELNAMGME